MRMKKLFGISVLIIIIISSYSQEDNTLTPDTQRYQTRGNNDEIQTLFTKDGKTSHGAYGGINLFYTNLGMNSLNRNAFILGMKGAWVIDHVFEIGLDVNSFISEAKPDALLGNSSYLYTGGYGGFLLAFNIFPTKPINVSIPITIGAGGVSYMGNYYSYDEYYDYYPESFYGYFLVQPGVELQLNMTKFMRISIHASYRYTSNIYLEYSISPDLIGNENLMRGFNLGASVKFGKF